MSHVFISYRRDGGEAMAQLIHDRLVSAGVDVFYDIDDLNSSSPFDSMLFHKIEESNDIVLILPPQALDRCRYENDWVRQEIRHAMLLKKNIIPVMMRGFEFPSDLPEDIKDVSRFNGVRMDSMEYLDAKIERIISFMSEETRKARDEKNKKTKSGSNETQTSTGSGTQQTGGGAGAANPGATRPIVISNVCTMGAANRDELWPKGFYSPIINLDECNVVRFHGTLLRSFDRTTSTTIGFNIYDSAGKLVCESSNNVVFAAGDNRFSLGWIIRGLDGTYVKTGRYLAEVWIGNSERFSVQFTVESQIQNGGHRSGYGFGGMSIDEINANIYKVEGKLNTYKVFLSNIITGILFLLSLSLLTNYESGMGMVLLFASIVSWIITVKNTRKYVVKSVILALLFTTIGSGYYSIYLFVMMIVNHGKKDQLKQELASLKFNNVV